MWPRIGPPALAALPVILRREDFERWLDPSPPVDDLLAPAPAGSLRLFRVDPKVNSYKIDDPSCIAPLVAEEDKGPADGLLV